MCVEEYGVSRIVMLLTPRELGHVYQSEGGHLLEPPRRNNMSTLSKWKFSASLIAVILAAAPSSLVSQAQFADESVVVNVPFAFGDGSKNFAAGRYSIAMNEQKILAIRSDSNSGFVMAWLEQDSHPAETSKVVFRKYGDQYFLSEIWIAGESSHTYRMPSKQEKREMAANKAAPTDVVVAALEVPR